MSNFQQYLKWLIYVILFSLVAIFHVSFISALPPFFASINLSLIVLFFILLFTNLNTALVISILLGFWLDILTFSFFGINSLSLFMAIYLVNLLLTNWLTNRSLYSFLALSLIGIVIYNFLLQVLLLFWQGRSIVGNFFLFNSSFWLSLSWQMVWGSIFIILFFNLANSLSRRLKPFFLEKK